MILPPKNILIELIITNQCNKRCKYCDLDFRTISQTKENLSTLSEFLHRNSGKMDKMLVNFFGGEALLRFDLIKYFLSKNSGISNISYSIGTNGLLLDEEKFRFFEKIGTQICLSIDTENYEHIFEKTYLREYNLLTVNFILNPNTIEHSFHLLERLVEFGFKNFNFIPVFSTIRWTIPALVKLKNFKTFVEKFLYIRYEFYSYYSKPTSDSQFIFDTDGYFYKDIHSHFWIMKQLSFLDSSIKTNIHSFTQLAKLDEFLDINLLIDQYGIASLLKKSNLLARQIGFERDFRVLDKIISQ